MIKMFEKIYIYILDDETVRRLIVRGQRLRRR